MKLKSRIILMTTLIAIIFIAISYYAMMYRVLPTFHSVEETESLNDIKLAKVFIEDQIQHIAIQSLDWAIWDDTYNFINNIKRQEFIYSTMPESILETTNLDVIMLHNLDKDIIHYRMSPVSDYKNTAINKIHILLENNEFFYNPSKPLDKQEVGILSTPYGILLLASSPIVHSDKTGPAIGTFSMAKFFTEKDIQEISKKANMDFNIWLLNDPGVTLPVNDDTIDYLKTNNVKFIISQNGKSISTYSLLKDKSGKPTFLVSIEKPRTIYLKAVRVIHLSMIVIIVISIVLLGILTVLIHENITRPLANLANMVSAITQSKDFDKRTDISRKQNDEIGILSREFDSLLDELQFHIRGVEDKVEKKVSEIKETRKDAIFRLALVLEGEKSTEGSFVEKTRKLMTLFAQRLNIPHDKCELFGLASTMHDIGKMGIPEYISNKFGKFTPEEINTIKSHTIVGASIFADATSDLVKLAGEMALHHHEHWDGTGYVSGIKGKNIPLSARMLIIINTFISLIAKRKFKKDFNIDDDVISYLKNNSGKMFDPKLIKIFLENIDAFIEITDSLKGKHWSL